MLLRAELSEDRNLRTAALDALAATGDSARASQVALRLVADPDPLFAQSAVADAAKVGGATSLPSASAQGDDPDAIDP